MRSVNSAGGSLSRASCNCLMAASCSSPFAQQLGQLEAGVGAQLQVRECSDQRLISAARLLLASCTGTDASVHFRRRHERHRPAGGQLLLDLVLHLLPFVLLDLLARRLDVGIARARVAQVAS